MKLVASLASPFARKVRTVLAEKNISFDFHESIPWTADSDVPEYNPLGRVPALVDDNGKAWTDSAVIVEFLETLSTDHRLIPETATDAVQVKQLQAFADGMCEAGIAIFLERNRETSNQSQDWINRQLTKLERSFGALDQELEGKDYSFGNTFTLSDIAIVCMLQWTRFRLPDIRWQKFPNLVRFNDLHKSRPCLKETEPE